MLDTIRKACDSVVKCTTYNETFYKEQWQDVCDDWTFLKDVANLPGVTMEDFIAVIRSRSSGHVEEFFSLAFKSLANGGYYDPETFFHLAETYSLARVVP